MITIIDTIRALSDWIEGLFGEPPTTKDITEGFERPCTYIQPGTLDTAVEGGLRHDTYTMDVIRFATRTRSGWLELLEWQAKLTAALEHPIPVQDLFVLYPEDASFDLRRDDMVLITSITLDNFQVLPPADADVEEMDTLILNGEE